MTIPIKIRGVRQTIPTGYVAGRFSSGSGDLGLISIAELSHKISQTGIVGGVQEVDTAGAGISGGPITGRGTLTVEWNGGTVAAIGTGLTIVSGNTLEVTGAVGQWSAGTVVAIGPGLTIGVGNTLEVTGAVGEWTAGTVTTVGTGLAINSDTLVSTIIGAVLPLVTGDTPGPVLIADTYGQCIGVPL